MKLRAVLPKVSSMIFGRSGAAAGVIRVVAFGSCASGVAVRTVIGLVAEAPPIFGMTIFCHVAPASKRNTSPGLATLSIACRSLPACTRIADPPVRMGVAAGAGIGAGGIKLGVEAGVARGVDVDTIAMTVIVGDR